MGVGCCHCFHHRLMANGQGSSTRFRRACARAIAKGGEARLAPGSDHPAEERWWKRQYPMF